MSACKTLKTLTLNKWAMPISDLRAGDSVAVGGNALSDAEGGVICALVKGNDSLTKLDLSGSECSTRAW